MQTRPAFHHLLALPLALAVLLAGGASAHAAPVAVAATSDSVTEATRIAVLPFEQLKPQPEYVFLQAGFAETLTTSLARVRSLQVVERGQIRRVLEELKLQHTGVVEESKAAEIGKVLGARQVVVGSFGRYGNLMRVDCRFVDVQTGAVDPNHTATVTRKLVSEDDILTVLDDLAADVVKGFGVRTTAQEQQQIQQVTHATVSVSAFQYYTQAREKFLLYTPEGYRDAIPLYEKAIQVDERYALAWAGLAESFGFWGYQKKLNGEDDAAATDFRRCLDAAKRAVEIAPNLGEAHRALAEAYSHTGEPEENSDQRAERRRKAALRATELNERDAEAYYQLWSATGQELEGESYGYIQKALQINPRLNGALVDLGARCKDAGRVDEAIRYYQRALEVNPRDANAWNNLANAYLSQDKVDDAITAYEKALAIEANDAIVQSNYGNALKRKGRLDEAVAAYLKAIDINPKYAAVYYNLGLAYRTQEKYEEAEACFLRGSQLAPEDPDHFTGLGGVYRAQKRYDKALEAYRKALALKEDNSVTWYFVGECHKNLAAAATGTAQTRAYRQAVDAYLKCAKYDPKDPDPWFQLGTVYHALGDPDEAITAYRKVIELKPDHADANYNLALRLKEKGDKRGAATAMRRFLELARNDPDQADWIPRAEGFLRGLGDVAATDGETEDAEVAKARKALEENPGSANMHYNLALAYLKVGKPAEAQPLILKAIAIKDTDPDFFKLLGRAYREQKEWAKAIRAYEKALNLKDEDSVTYYWVGYCNRNLADAAEGTQQAKLYGEAIDAYRTCARYDPKDPDPWYSMGIVYDKLKKVDEALAAYERAVELKPNHTDGWYNLAVTYKQKGQMKKAVEAMQRFLALARNDPDQKEWVPRAEKFIRDLEAL